MGRGASNLGLFFPVPTRCAGFFGGCSPGTVPMVPSGQKAISQTQPRQACHPGGRHDGAMVAQHAFAVSNSSGPAAGLSARRCPAYGRPLFEAGIGGERRLSRPSGWQRRRLSGLLWPALVARSGLHQACERPGRVAPVPREARTIQPWRLGCRRGCIFGPHVPEQVGIDNRWGERTGEGERTGGLGKKMPW